jgi:hypothetical protein
VAKGSRPKRPAKLNEVEAQVRAAVEDGRYRYTVHGSERLDQRIVRQGILETDVTYVLKHGRRESRKDTWNELRQSWSYAMRGKTIDEVNLRVCVAFDVMPDQTLMVIVTIINLDLEEDSNV